MNNERISLMIKEMKNIMSPMRDGVKLACNVYRPDDDKAYPAILLRTPYIKENIDNELVYANYRQMAMAGYNMIFQDVRGTGASEGVLDPTGAMEGEDGYDSIEWIAAQPWCDGNVGMQGLSYFGFTQMAAAELNPPHLKAICPFQNSSVMPFSVSKAGTFGNFHLMWIYGRVLENLERWYPDKARQNEIKEKIEYYRENWNNEMLKLPLKDTPAARIDGVPQAEAFLELLDGMEDESFMIRARRPAKIENINVPMLFLTGWFDGARDGTFDNWYRAQMGSFPKENRKLIVGPWVHGGRLHTDIDGRDYGTANSGDGIGIQETIKRWFDYWLKGEENGIINEAPVRLFMLGKNEWRDETEWPPAQAKETCFYIHGGDNKNNGGLNQVHPKDDPSRSSNNQPQSYIYDPNNPLPSAQKDKQGRTLFADVSEQQSREDVLVYTSQALDKDLMVSGLVNFKLYASTDAPDTDFFCRLSDVDETGYAFPLLSGIVRCRFRNGRKAEMLEPNKVYPLTIELGNISNVFLKGHKIRIDISSSFYPEHDRNLNTADRIGYGTYCVKAKQTIFHDENYPSHLLLPVLE